MSVGAERGGTASGWPDTLPWIAVAVLALGAGAAACFASPALGIAALALPAAPLLVLAPDLAILALVAALPFDALAALDDTGMLTVTRLLGIAVLGGWVVHVVAHPRQRVRLGRPGLLLLAYVAFAAVSIGWSPDTDVALTALMTLAQLFLLYVMAANVFDDWSRIARGLDVLLLSTAVLAVIVLVQNPGVQNGGFGLARAVVHYGTHTTNPNFPGVPAGASRGRRARVPPTRRPARLVAPRRDGAHRPRPRLYRHARRRTGRRRRTRHAGRRPPTRRRPGARRARTRHAAAARGAARRSHRHPARAMGGEWRRPAVGAARHLAGGAGDDGRPAASRHRVRRIPGHLLPVHAGDAGRSALRAHPQPRQPCAAQHLPEHVRGARADRWDAAHARARGARPRAVAAPPRGEAGGTRPGRGHRARAARDPGHPAGGGLQRRSPARARRPGCCSRSCRGRRSRPAGTGRRRCAHDSRGRRRVPAHRARQPLLRPPLPNPRRARRRRGGER